MSANINLLLHTDGETLRRQKRVKILNFVAVMLLIGVGATSLIIFLLIQVVNPSGVKKEQEDILKKISQFQSKQVKLFILNNRVENIEKIMAKRKDLSKATNILLAKTPTGILIEDLEIDGKTVVMTASSTSLWAIGELISNLTDMVKKREIIISLTLNSLVFDENKNIYEVSVKSELQI